MFYMKYTKYFRHVVKYLVAIFLILFVFKYFLKPQDIELLKQISISNFIAIVLIGLLINTISGFQYYYLINKQSGTKLSVSDIITLPISMGLWGLILPVQGALIYLTIFLKLKYKTRISESIAITLFSYLITVCFSGIVGIYYSIVYLKKPFSTISITSLVCIFVPFFLFMCSHLLSKMSFGPNSIFDKTKIIVTNIVTCLTTLFKDKKTVGIILLINIVHTIITAFWYYFTCVALKIPVSFMANLILAMLSKLTIILKITPGNIGVDELLSGGLFSSLGVNPAWGVIVSFTARASIVLLMLTLGLVATIHNSKYFHIKDLFKEKI
jgi:hypothetical protein